MFSNYRLRENHHWLNEDLTDVVEEYGLYTAVPGPT